MLNQLVVIGRLTKDPELRKTDAGRSSERSQGKEDPG